MATIVVPLAPGFEEIEAVAVIDILRRGGVTVITAGVEGAAVTGARGVTLQCDTLLSAVDAKQLDGIVLPGGMPGTRNLMKSSLVRDMVIALDRDNLLVAAICAAPTVLHAAGVLKGKKATSYPGYQKEMTEAVYSEAAVVADGNVITSRAAGTAVPFALALVERLSGLTTALEVKKAILA
jgi:4-methyl-5(b-hydroxyethyl)-thiazole monophosphate biosynthesis